MVPFPSISRVYMVMVLQDDLEKGVTFYRDTLELPCLFYIQKEWAEFELEGLKLGLCQKTDTSGPMHTGIVLEVKDLKTTLTALKERGIEPVQNPVVANHGIIATIADPSGNLIDLYQPEHAAIRQQLERLKQGCCKSSTA